MYKVAFGLFIISTAFGNIQNQEISEALGHMIGQNLQSLNIPLDLEAIAKGMQDESDGLSSPMSDTDCIAVIGKLQEEKNLKEAALFLEANKMKEGVVSLSDGKLQFKILKKGAGEPVQSYNSPLVRLKRTGEANDQRDSEEIIALDEAIHGLRLGIVGMCEGEVRKLYIHPSLGYGRHHTFDRPGSLLIFEVEVIKADASSEAHAASNSDSLPIFLDLDDISPKKR